MKGDAQRTERDLPRGVAVLESGVLVHFDGACEPSPTGRIACWAFVAEGPDFAHEESGLAAAPGSPSATNNVAEYLGAIRALEYLRQRGYRGPVTLLGDSQLVIRQFRGEYAVRTEHLKAYHDRLHQLAREFPKVEFFWVPRRQNQRADALTKQAVASVRRTLPHSSGSRES